MTDSPSRLIDARIKELGDWRGELLARIRKLIKQADPDVVEEWKWRGVPVWYHDGMICTGETYKNVVKMTFAKGASLEDPSGLFNSSLDGNTRRAIDFHEGDKIDDKALKALIRAAVEAERVLGRRPVQSLSGAVQSPSTSSSLEQHGSRREAIGDDAQTNSRPPVTAESAETVAEFRSRARAWLAENMPRLDPDQAALLERDERDVLAAGP